MNSKNNNEQLLTEMRGIDQSARLLAESALANPDGRSSLEKEALELNIRLKQIIQELKICEPAFSGRFSEAISESSLDIRYVLATKPRGVSLRLGRKIRRNNSDTVTDI